MRFPCKRKLAVAAFVVLFTPFIALHVASYCVSLPSELREGHAGSVRVLNRDGHLLRDVRPADGSRTAWVTKEDAALVAEAIVATEDRRFASHHGVDYQAVLRAAWSNLTHGGTVSGASTITMQLARTVRPHPHTLWGKLTEAAVALRIERALTKGQILEEYLNRVEFGPNLRGVGAASRAYFDKPPAALSLGEGSLLAGVVRGPSYYDLEKHAGLASARRKIVLSRMIAAGVIDEDQAKIAEEEPIVLQQRAPAFGALHFVRALLGGRLGALPDASGGSITTTLDTDVQRASEIATQRVIGSLGNKHVTAASVVVLDNATGDVLAYVGSPDFFDEARAGQNDGVLSMRQPGSTLKPFVYELAMERLRMTPATVLPDIELHLSTPSGDFAPHDYDESFHGPVRMREALANSLNVPAVYVADQLGPASVLDRLHALGFLLDKGANEYGAAIALGDGEVTLLELANAYATLARGGVKKPVRAALSVDVAGAVTLVEAGAEERVIPELAAARITDVLKDRKARAASFGEGSVLEFSFDAAGKTGTSKGYRDNWAVGYTKQITVAAWVGNFDGSAMDHVSGITGAGPLFHDVMDAAMVTREKLPLPLSQSDFAGELERVEDLSALRRARHACMPEPRLRVVHARRSGRACVRRDARNGRRRRAHGSARRPRAERHVPARREDVRAVPGSLRGMGSRGQPPACPLRVLERLPEGRHGRRLARRAHLDSISARRREVRHRPGSSKRRPGARRLGGSAARHPRRWPLRRRYGGRSQEEPIHAPLAPPRGRPQSRRTRRLHGERPHRDPRAAMRSVVLYSARG